MNKIPTLQQIKDDLQKIINLTKDLHTYEDVVKFESEHKKDIERIEINGETTKVFNFIGVNYGK